MKTEKICINHDCPLRKICKTYNKEKYTNILNIPREKFQYSIEKSPNTNKIIKCDYFIKIINNQ